MGSVIILIVGLANPALGLSSAWDGIRLVFGGLVSTGRDAAGSLTFGFNPTNMGNMLLRATPLILTGLSVAVAFKTGLFNIGAPGQYLMGTAATPDDCPGYPSRDGARLADLGAGLVGGILAGALWGCLPGLVKAFLNINEVLACIMTNWIAANLVTWMFDGSQFRNVVRTPRAASIYKTSFNGVETAKLGLNKLFPNSQVNGGIVIAVVIAVLVYILMSKTTLGYQPQGLRQQPPCRPLCRHQRQAQHRALYGHCRRTLRCGGGLYYLSGNIEFFWSTYQSLPAIGFNGIPVALLAANNPIAVIFTGCFMSMLDIVGLQLTNLDRLQRVYHGCDHRHDRISGAHSHC